MNPPPLRFTIEQAHAAADEWGFNCGPAALCAALELTPDEVRPHLDGFDRKRCTNPTMMWGALKSLGVKLNKTVLGPKSRQTQLAFPSFGLARVQWGGPWCDPGRPPQAAYRHTHWVAAVGSLQPPAIYDVNYPGSWVALESWTEVLVREILEGLPKSDGRWWLTHSVEVRR
jgi:hypothetical protein